jgi:hypothetical protein
LIIASFSKSRDGLSTSLADPTDAELDEIDTIDIRVRVTTSFDASQRIAKVDTSA